MLVLSRKTGESIFIGSDIEIKVISISKDKVKLGFEAPKNIAVIRGELQLAIMGANIEATRGKIDMDLLKNLSLEKKD